MDARDWKQTLAIGIWSGLTIVAVVVLARRANGAFGETPHAVAACAIALATMALALVANVLFQLTRRPTSQPAVSILAGVITLAPPIVLGVTLLASRSAPAVSFLATLFVLASAAVVVSGDRIAQTRSPWELDRVTNSGPNSPAVLEEMDESVWQWMTRTGSATGQDCVRGAIKVDLQPGQRRANIHIPFSPPFGAEPKIECEVVNECPIRLSVSAAHPYGARIELHRTAAPVAREIVEVSYLVTATAEPTLKAA